ncbi:MAG: DUF4846 domain-containing protein [candidate division Zixibacteria bacterium]
MKILLRVATFAILFYFLISTLQAQPHKYNWANDYDSNSALINYIPLPAGYKRTAVEANSYADWLRHLPVKDGQKVSYTYDGRPAMREDVVYAILDIDIGSSDLQQCADAIIRLHAEYLYTLGKYRDIKYKFTSGDTSRFDNWIKGYRPLVDGSKVSWAKSEIVDSSYKSFRNYLYNVFMYAGTYSLEKEMGRVRSYDSIQIGDALILPGFPGHAVMVADIVFNEESGERSYLFIQGYTPAQDIHVIKNPLQQDSLPWFELKPNNNLRIMHWIFDENNIRRFK